MSRVASRPRTAALTAIVALAAGALAASVLVPVVAAAAPVALSGLVVKPSGSVAAGLKVTAVRTSDEVAVGTVTTSSSGTFTFASLPAGDYTLKFPKTSTSFAQYLGGESDVDDAQVLELTDAGGNKSFVRVALSASGSLAGTVKKPSGSALSGYSVRVYDGATVVASATTGTTGKYSVTGLEPGDYVLQATSTSSSPSTAGSWSGGASSVTEASPVLVQAKQTTSYNFVLGASAKIGGVVTGSYGGSQTEKLANVLVTPYRVLESGDLEPLVGLARKTNASGAYTLTALPAGTYTLRFDPPATAAPSGTTYGLRYWESTNAVIIADRFPVASGASITGKNIELVGAVSIAGDVTDAVAPHAGLADLLVTVSPNGGEIDRSKPFTTHTDATGHYEVSGLSSGEYEVTVGSFADSDPGDGITEDTTRTRTSQIIGTPGPLANTADFEIGSRQPVAATTAPSIETAYGVEVGDDVWADTGDWTQNPGSDLDYTFQWYRSGQLIEGATSQGYKLSPGDYGNDVTVEVTAHDPAWGTGTASSTGVTVAQGGKIYNTGGFEVFGDFEVGSTVGIELGDWYAPGWGPVDPTFEIEWLAGTLEATATVVGTGPTHIVTASDRNLGPYLFYRGEGTRWGFQDANPITSISHAILDGTFTATKAPKLTKSTTKFTVSKGTWAPEPDSVDVVWTIYEANGSSTTSTGTTLTRTSAQKGKYISVTITPVGAHVNATPVVLTVQTGKGFTSTGSTALVGTPKVGSPLSAPTLVWLPEESGTSYKWQYLSGSTWKTIPGVGSTSSYSPSATYLGKKVRVAVTVSKTGYPNATKTSSAVTIGLGVAPTVSGTAPAISTPAVNVAGGVSSGDWTPTPTSYAYKWKIGDSETGPFTTISGATGATFTPSTAQLGKWLVVELTAKRTGHASTTVTLPAAEVMAGVVKNTVKPSVTATGDYLFTDNGQWSPTPNTFVTSWQWTYHGVTHTSPEGSASANLTGYPTAPVWLSVTAEKAGWASGEITFLARKGVIFTGDVNQIQTLDGPYVDELFTAIPDNSFDPLPSDITSETIQWEYEKSPGVWGKISGATGTEFTPTGTTYLGKKIRYKVTRTADDYLTSTEISDEVVVQQGLQPQGLGFVTYLDAPTVTDTAAWDPITWDMPVTETFRWQLAPSSSGPWTTITGATKASYKVPMSAYLKYIRLIVTVSRPGHESRILTLPGVQVLDGQLDNVTPPQVTKSGSTLTATAGTWDAPGVLASYEWRQYEPGGSNSVVGSAPTLALTSGMAGKKIELKVTAAAPNTIPGSVTVVAQKGAGLELDEVAQQAQPVVGTQVWYATEWTLSGVTETYQWYRNGVAIPGATGIGYEITNADLGKAITLKLTGSKPGYTPFTVKLSAGTATTWIAPHNVTPPTITRPGGEGSNTRVDETIVATPGTWDLSGITVQYQWWSPTGPIPGATSASYSPRVSDLGSEVWVETRAIKPYYTPSAWEDSYRVLVGWGVAPALVSPTDFETDGISVTGTSTIVLKSKPVVWNVPGSTTTYQWERMHAGDSGFTEIPGATSNSYTLGVDDVAGDQFRLKIDVWAPGHPAGQKVSNIKTPLP